MTTSREDNAVADEVWTVLRLLEWTTEFLSSRGSSSARLDAEVLLGKALGCKRIDLYTSYDHVATDEQRDEFRTLVRERAAGAPVAYLVGEREFYSRMFAVNRSVLVPRPETEFVILELLDRLQEQPIESPTIIDIGTGSGVLAITAAHEIGAARVIGVDVSAAALEVASQNIVSHGLGDRVQAIPSDLLADVPNSVEFNIVISNPPYVAESEWESLDGTVKDHEPRMALVGGQTGAEVIACIVEQAADRLPAGGLLVMELSPMIADQVTDLIRGSGAFSTPRLRSDLSKQARVVSCVHA